MSILPALTWGADMYGWLGTVCLLAAFLGAVPLLPLGVLFLWLQERSEEKARHLALERHNARQTFRTSYPGACPVCGAQAWVRSALRILPAMGIRSIEFSMQGNAAVARFTCSECGSFGRYARAYAEPEQGWYLLDRDRGGW